MELTRSEKKDLAIGLCENKDKEYSKRSVAKALGLSEGTMYYKNQLESKDLLVKQLIDQIYETDDTLGCKKLAPLLKMGKGRISRVMLKYNIIPRKRSPQYRYAVRANDRVDNVFLSDKDVTNYEVLFSDIFEFRLAGGKKVYGCFLIRKKTRQILAFSYSFSMEAKIVSGTIKHMIFNRDLEEAQVIFHSDQGKQFGAEVTVKQLLEYEFERSMSRAGTPTDNGIAERFVGIFKHSVVQRYLFERHEEFAEFTNKWLNFYNNQRSHESLGGKSPNQFASEKGLSEVRIITVNLL